jgi:Putative beta-barrel porin 2
MTIDDLRMADWRIERCGRLLVMACLAFLLRPSSAQAQIEAPRESAQIEFGTVSLYPSLQLADAGIDENVFNDGSDPKKDVTFTLSSEALAVWRVGLNELMFSTGSDYVWFKDYESERASNYNYALRFNLSASRFKPYVGAQHTRTSTRPTPEIDTRARRTTRVGTVGSSFDLTERTGITASAQWDEATFDDDQQFRGVDLAEGMSHVGHAYGGGFRYAVTPFTTLSVNGSYRRQIFPQSHLRDSKSYRITPRVDFAPEAVIRGSFTAGYEVFVPDDPEFSRNQGLVLEGTLNWAIATMTMFDLTVGRNVNYSYLDEDPYYLQTGARLTVTQRLMGPVGLQGTAERQHLSYHFRRGVTPTPGFEPRKDRSNIFGAGVVVNIGNGLSLLVGAERAERISSEDPMQNFTRTRILSTITVGK